MTPPSIYIVVEAIGSAYWFDGPDLVSCAIHLDGSPDFANSGIDEFVTKEEAGKIAAAIEVMTQLAEQIKEAT